MRFCRIAVALLFLFSASYIFAQSDTVRLKISMTDGYTSRPVPGGSVIYPRHSATLNADPKGYIELTVGKSDTLFVFSPGYKPVRFSVKDSVYKREYHLHFVLEPLTATIKSEVVIKAPKTLEQIEKERQNLGITPKELEKPRVAPSSTISALYELLSHRAKERETLKRQITEDDRRKVFKDLLNYYNSKQLIDLPENHYDRFIDFCNLPIEFFKSHTDYEIMKTITSQYERYARLSGLVK